MSPSTLLDRILWTQLARVVHGSPPEWEPGTASARAIRGVLAETTLDLDESAIVDRWDPGGEASRVLFDRLLQARVNRAVHAGLRVEAEKLGPAETPKPSKVLIVREGAPEEELEKTAPWRLHPKKTVVEFLAGAVGGFLACMLLSGCGAGVAGVVAASGNNGGGGTAPTVLTSFRIPNPRVSPAVLQLGITGTAPVQAALFYKRPGESRQPMTRISGLGGSNSVLLAEPGADLSWDFAAEPLLEGTHFVDEVTVEVEFPGGVIPDGGVLEPEPGIGNDPPVIEDVLVPTGGVSSGVIPVGVRVSDTSSDVLSITFEWRRQGESDDDWKPATPAGLFPDEEPLEGIQASPEGISRTVSWDAMADLVDENADVELRFTPDDGTRDAADNPVGRGESMLSSPFRVENHSNPALNAFLVQNPKTSPARLVLDASQALRVAMSFDAGQGERAVTQLSGPGITGNEVDLPAGETQLDWDFASEFGTASFIPDVRLIASFSGSVISGGELVVDLGNDAPVIAIEPAASEVSGVVPIQLIVFDTSDDIVSIFAEFDIQGDSPDAGWRLARPGGLDPATPTPFPTLAGILAPANGTELVFFWDTGFDLEGLDREVVLRFTPSDGTLDTGGSPVGIGQPATTALFRVKNNAAPIVQILNDVVIANSDERRGIPIPFRALDAER
jgi:hypothetical protein